MCMALSARNQFRGQIKGVKLGGVMAHVAVQVGDNEIESVITRRSAEGLDLMPSSPPEYPEFAFSASLCPWWRSGDN